MMFPDTHAKSASTMTMMADEPVANPSIPSVRFAPLEIPVTIKIVTKMNTNQPYFSYPSPKKLKKLE